MEEDKILICREIYDELSSAFEKIEAVERLVNMHPGVPATEILAVLGIIGK